MSQEISAPVSPLLNPPAESPQMNHGRTAAGWALFWVASIGTLIAGIGVILFSMAMVWTGAIVVAVGVALSVALRIMGHGQPVKKTDPPSVEDL